MENQLPPQNIPIEQPPQIPPIPQNSNRSFWKTIAIGMAIVSFCTAIALGGYLLGTNKNKPQAPEQTTNSLTSTPATVDKFDEKMIIKLSAFTNTAGEDKRFIIVKTGDRDGIPVVDTYISDPNLSRSSAVKISALSGENASLGHVGDNVLVSFSPGPIRKFILVSYQIADGFYTFLLDEKGTLISDAVVDNAYELVKDECQCGFGFDSWADQAEFFVEVRTALGNDYRVLVDANTGKTIGLPQKKD